MGSWGLGPLSVAGRGRSVAGPWKRKLCQKPRAARLYGVLNYAMAIPDTPDRTYVLERGCGVCVGKRRFSRDIGERPACLAARSHSNVIF